MGFGLNKTQVVAVVQSLSSVQFSHSVMYHSLQPHGLQHTVSLPITNSRSLLKLMFIESVMPSNNLVNCHTFLLLPSIFPSIRVFSHESVLHIRWPQYWSSASASVLPMIIQDWFPLGFTGWISLQSTGLSRVSSNTTVQMHQFFGTQLSFFFFSFLDSPILTSIHDYWKNHSFD